MPDECSICMSSYREPVCVPCGHIFCKGCLMNHLNIQNNEDRTAPCPVCRALFVGSDSPRSDIRRLFLDQAPKPQSLSRLRLASNLENELGLSRERVKQLQKDNAWLLKQCARLTSREEEARGTASAVQCQLRKKEEALDKVEENLDRCVSELAQLHIKYDTVKKKSRYLKKECKEDCRMARVTQFFDELLREQR